MRAAVLRFGVVAYTPNPSAACIPESDTRGSRASPSLRGRCAGSRGRSSITAGVFGGGVIARR